MFSKPTVFIIGAGASAELGLPPGSDLKQTISEAVRFRFDLNEQVSGDRDLYQSMCGSLGQDVGRYTKLGDYLADMVPLYPSIDEALNFFSTAPDVVRLGKFAIAHFILRGEHSSMLCYKPGQKCTIDAAANTWLAPFLSMAISPLTREQIDGAFKNVTIINFNYDRTIERYLELALKGTAKMGEKEAISIIQNIRIIRPYGSLGPLRSGKDDVIFGGHEHGGNNDLVKISANILTFTEPHSGGDTHAQIKDAISGAKVIVILGFGFHQQNMELLSVPVKDDRHVFATVSGIDINNHEMLRDLLRDRLGTSRRAHLINASAHDMLERLRLSIMQVAS